ncbi:phosphoglycerate dehydrogenase [Roseibium suaedae]|uniref:D-3-phosphoglycerate dehydrogenase n=1 Tax=Roseibium suaedae TaxID=735517 RepID=A0A1M7P7U8_9HYPH|nr:phosphoglycerate dehydrogenase [Roseibium suaedae]SHN12484.1 D-3-phosphoglycerate dehydrogenase [Roseibium suaedae]
MKILLTCKHLQKRVSDFSGLFEKAGIEAIVPEVKGQQLDADEMLSLIEGIDGIIAGDDIINKKVIDAGKASKLKAIVKWGIGVDGIDLVHARSVGMPVFNTPGCFSEEVADVAYSHLLMLARHTMKMHNIIMDNGWQNISGTTLAGKTVGVVGLGSIGLGVARRAGGFGLDILGYDVRPCDQETLDSIKIRQTDLPELLAKSDIVIICCALTPENAGLFCKDTFDQMKDGVIVINVSRGGLINEPDLCDALESGKVKAAGLDVFAAEPLPADARIRNYADRCTFSAHSGSNTVEAVNRINAMTVDILLNQLLPDHAVDFTPNKLT